MSIEKKVILIFRKIVIVCLTMAWNGCSDSARVKSLVYEDLGGEMKCKCCGDLYCPICLTHGIEVTCLHKERYYRNQTEHPIIDISAKRKLGVEDIWLITLSIECPQRGVVTGTQEWSYRNGKVFPIRWAQ